MLKYFLLTKRKQNVKKKIKKFFGCRGGAVASPGGGCDEMPAPLFLATQGRQLAAIQGEKKALSTQKTYLAVDFLIHPLALNNQLIPINIKALNRNVKNNR